MKSGIKLCFVYLAVSLFLGACRQNKYNPDDRSWVEAANQRIKKYRKADISISVVDKNGRAIKGALITLNQTKQAFDFGTVIKGKYLLADSDSAYRNIVKTHFNLIVPSEFQWILWNDPAHGGQDKQLALNVLQWGRENDIAVKGHYLSWAPVRNYKLLTRALSYDEYKTPPLYKKALFTYINDVLVTTKGNVREWDVINHLVAKNQNGQLATGGNKLSIDDYLGADIYKKIVDTVKQIDPGLKLFVNEDNLFSVGSSSYVTSYYNKIVSLKKQGVALDGIGFMSHFMNNDLTSMSYVKSVFDRYARLGLPLKITEFDVRFGNRGEKYEMSASDMELQKQYTADFMRLCYSCPDINGFIIWGFWEGDDWYPSAALYNTDWSIKPNGKVWEQLVMHEWKTNTTGKTDDKGNYHLNAFLGDYNLVIKDEKGNEIRRTFNLDKKGKTLVISL